MHDNEQSSGDGGDEPEKIALQSVWENVIGVRDSSRGRSAAGFNPMVLSVAEVRKVSQGKTYMDGYKMFPRFYLSCLCIKISDAK